MTHINNTKEMNKPARKVSTFGVRYVPQAVKSQTKTSRKRTSK